MPPRKRKANDSAATDAVADAESIGSRTPTTKRRTTRVQKSTVIEQLPGPTPAPEADPKPGCSQDQELEISKKDIVTIEESLDLTSSSSSSEDRDTPTPDSSAAIDEPSTSTGAARVSKPTAISEFFPLPDKILDPVAIEVAKKYDIELNPYNWPLEALHQLHNGITWYGTSDCAMATITSKYFLTKHHEDLQNQLKHIRRINRAVRMERMELEREAYMKQSIISNRKRFYDWHMITVRMAQQNKATKKFAHDKFAQKAVERVVHEVAMTMPEHAMLTKASDTLCIKSCGVLTTLSWRRIYEQLGAWATNKPIGQLTALEAAVLLSIMDEIKDEAISQPEEQKRKWRYTFDMLMQDDYRNFTPDVPPCKERAVPLVVDPLRTRGIPAGPEDEYEVIVQEDDDLTLNDSQTTEKVIDRMYRDRARQAVAEVAASTAAVAANQNGCDHIAKQDEDEAR